MMKLGRSFFRDDGTMRALTLWPEWAWAVHYLDKRLENRGYKLPFGEWIALHAGAHLGGRKGSVAEAEARENVRDMAIRAGWTTDGGLWNCYDFRRGDQLVRLDPTKPLNSMIHGLFRVNIYAMGAPGGWHVPGQIGNCFEYLPLAEPVPCKGAQGLWTVPADVVEQMRVAA